MALEILRTPDFDVWLKQLRDRRGAAKIAERIERMRLGNFGDFKFVGSGVFEVAPALVTGPISRVEETRSSFCCALKEIDL